MAARGTGHAHEGLGGAIVVGACLVVGVHLTTFSHSATHGFITLSVRPFSQLLKKIMPIWVESGMYDHLVVTSVHRAASTCPGGCCVNYGKTLLEVSTGLTCAKYLW